MVRTAILAALLVGALGCATYRDDFDRARVHYDANEYDQALLLLEVLERDIDSLSEADRAKYAYYRGMSHFRLDQKRDARHWLGNAAAREKASQGGLEPDQKTRVDETLVKLNAPYFGETEAEESEASAGCKTDLDCGRSEYCDAGRCTPSGGGSGAAKPKKKPASEPAGKTAEEEDSTEGPRKPAPKKSKKKRSEEE